MYRDPSRIIHQHPPNARHPGCCSCVRYWASPADQPVPAAAARRLLREVDYIQAARALGREPRRSWRANILPNVMHIILITVVLDFSGLVLAEAVLVVRGRRRGIRTMDSWGNMIASARLEMARDPLVRWSLARRSCSCSVWCWQPIFSDAVRDAFDPRLRK